MFSYRIMHGPDGITDDAVGRLQEFAGSESIRVLPWAGDHSEQRGILGETTRTVDLLYVAPWRVLEPAVAQRFALEFSAQQIGVLSDADGVVIAGVAAPVLARFWASRGAQDDEEVYRRGADHRLAYELERIPVPLPRQLYLGLTQKCDRHCSFCVSRTFDFDLLGLDEIRRIARDLDGDIDVIALTGAGEAMTHPHFWEAMDLLTELFPVARFKMNTSGMSLKRNAFRLLGYPIKNITVSLNATTEETYRKFVGKGLNAVIDGIRHLAEARSQLQCNDLRLCLSMVLMNSTLSELPDLVRLAFELGVEEVQGIHLMINDDTLSQESPYHHQDASNAWLDRAAAAADRLGVIASLPPRFGSMSVLNRDQPASLPTSQGHRCTEVFSTVYLRPNGEVTPCPYFDATVGSTRTSSLSQIWAGDQYEWIRDGLRTGKPPPQCQTCCGLNEGGRVDDYRSHWLGARDGTAALPMPKVQ